MGAKNDPGRYDCYAAAPPDEELFVLLDRDPVAPFLVSIWSSMRYGDIKAARIKFEPMIKRLGPRYAIDPNAEKAYEAVEAAEAMFRAQEARRP